MARRTAELGFATPGGAAVQPPGGPGPMQTGPMQAGGNVVTGQAPPASSSSARSVRWPWLVVAAAVIALVALTVVIVQIDSSKKELSASGATAADDNAAEPEPASTPTIEADGGLRDASPAPDPGFAKVPTYHPADTRLLIALQTRRLLDSRPVGAKLAGVVDSETAAPVVALAEMCKVDLLRDINWISIGFVDDDRMELIVSGNLNREKIESCMRSVLTDEMSLGWIDERTFLLSTRTTLEEGWMEDRVAGRDSFADDPAHQARLARMNLDATVWFMGSPKNLLEPTAEKVPDEVFGTVQVDQEIMADVWARYSGRQETEAAGKELKKEIEKFPQDALGELSVEVLGSELRVRAYLNALTTRILANYLGAELARKP